MCADLGISAKRAHNLRRQLTLPDEIRTRVAERPAGEELSVTMANRLADMHAIAPQLTEAVAKRITTDDLHDKALKDLGAFVHRTVVEDEHTYAVRIDDGALLDAAEQIEHARTHLTDRRTAADRGDPRLRARASSTASSTPLAARARTRALKVRITGEIRDRARNGRYAFVHDRGQDFAAGDLGRRPGLHDRPRPRGTQGRRHPRRPARRPTSPAPASTTTSYATPPPRTSSAGHKPAPATPRRPAATSGSGTTSAPD